MIHIFFAKIQALEMFSAKTYLLLYLEVDVAVLVAVKGAEHVITELVGVPRRETFRVDLLTRGKIQ